MLKIELRSMERSQKREGVDMTYLKNVVFKLLETGKSIIDWQDELKKLSVKTNDMEKLITFLFWKIRGSGGSSTSDWNASSI